MGKRFAPYLLIFPGGVWLLLFFLVPLVLMVGMALLTLLLVYHLIARNYPQWIAICVVCCMGVNSWFVRLSHEVLTDMPFLLGAIAALLGWDMLRTARETKSRVRAAILMSAGLLLAAVMRPTFWILCLALLLPAAPTPASTASAGS